MNYSKLIDGKNVLVTGGTGSFGRQLIKQVSNYKPKKIINTTRLGIPVGRDESLPYRFIDETFLNSCTKKPSTLIYI